jgi:lipopolysaccharide/colanic/teichoic acid biosynthesis glycosyltransferase
VKREDRDALHFSASAPAASTSDGTGRKPRSSRSSERKQAPEDRLLERISESGAEATLEQPPVPEAPPAVDYADIPPDVECGPTSPAKRAMDVTVGGLLIAILFPIFALAAVLIKLDSPGPVLIKQDRVGLNGRGFRFLKFRTMHHNRKGSDIMERLPTGDLTRRLLSPRGRPAHATAAGWALRKTTVDELPQLVNVVKGDMTLVGPRPDIQEIVDAWPPSFRQRHKVKPGMTGYAQVNGRSDLTHYEKVRYDLRYVRHHPISRDLRILLKTVTLVLSKKGAR